jgi:hypothetical protein
MAKTLERTALWLAMTAVAVNGHVFAQGVEGPTVVESFQETVAPAQPVFSVEQIEQMVAPIALYPDALLAQVLMAATYPIEVAQADQWLKKNRGLEGAALDDAVAAQPWDPSVKTLAFFPNVLDRMAQDLTWTQDLGDAFLAQEADVMGAVQRLRRQAQEAGSLASNSQQIVRTQGSTIVVEPADPTVVYVPSYNPATVYGPAWVPATTYYPQTYTYASAYPSWVTFGAGALVGALLVAAINWADDDDYYVYPYYRRPYHHHHINYVYRNYWDRDWDGPRYGHRAWRSYRPAYLDRRDVYVDRSRTVNIENNYFKREWEHNPVHRRNVTYRDPNVAKRFIEGDSKQRLDRDGKKWLGGEGARQFEGSGTRQFDRDALKRLDRSQPPMLPTDKGTREALQGDERERRARIMSGERDMKQFGAGAKGPEGVAPWGRADRQLEQKRFEGGEAAGMPPVTTQQQLERPGVGAQVKPTAKLPQLERPEGTAVPATPGTRELSRETKTWGKTEGGTPPPTTQSWGTRRSLESGTQGVESPQLKNRSESWQMQQRSEPRQFQYQRPPEPQIQKRSESWQMQQRSEPRQYQFQQRAQPKQMPPPTVQRSQEGSTRQFSQQRSAPKSFEPQRQQSGGQSSQQTIRKRSDDDDKKNSFGR